MARIAHYDQGAIWTPQATFLSGGIATDPTTVTVRIKEPDGTVVVRGPVSGTTGGAGIIRVSAGVFNTAVNLDDAGYWFARFEGTGAVVASEEHQAIVDPSEFYESAQLGSRALVTLAETKDWLQTTNIDTGNDLEIARVINDVSDRFHQEAEREFKVNGTNPQTRTFAIEPLGRRRPVFVDGDYIGDRNRMARTVAIGDLATLTGATITDTDWTTTLETVGLADITAHPLVRQSWEPITHLEFQSDVTALGYGMRVTVTGNWGFPEVPGNVRQAVLDAVVSVLDRDVESYRQDLAPTGGGGGLGSATTVVIGGGRQRLLSLPPPSAAVAWSYRNINVG